MPHVQKQNLALNTSNEQFTATWWLTRAMKTAGWRYRASGNGTTTVDTSGNPNNDIWGGGGVVQGPTTVAFTIGTPNSTAFGGRVTITGLAGMTSASAGHFLKITGATNGANNGTWLITKFISATSVQIENPAAIAETTPGSATYTELSAMLDTYPGGVAGSGAWICLQGPSTMKVPIGTAVPTGTFIKGENVTQATTGAKGEIIGVYVDTVYGGHLVISPRVSGTGGDPRGWDHTHAITGDASGAAATPTATVLEFVREVIFWYNNITTGHVYYQCIDSVGEATPTSATTTIAVASNGQGASSIATYGQIFVASTAGFPSSGVLFITTATRVEVVYYSGKTANSFLGCVVNSTGQGSPLGTGNAVVWSQGRFSTMAPLSASFNHPPGGIAGGDTTTNGFPTTGSYVPLGRGGAGTAATNPVSWSGYSLSVSAGKAQILCANCIEDANISADGSFSQATGVATTNVGNTTIAALSNGVALPTGTINVGTALGGGFASAGTILVTTSLGVQVVKYTGTTSTTFTGCTGGTGTMSTGGLVTAGFFALIGFLRLDDCEDGDVEPYAWATSAYPTIAFDRNQLGTGQGVSQTSNADMGASVVWLQDTGFMSWRRRGMVSGGHNPHQVEAWVEAIGCVVGSYQTQRVIETNIANGADLVACTPATITVREPIWVMSYGAATIPQQLKTYKGTTRWWNLVSSNASTDTYDGKLWIQLSSTGSNVVIGPADGTTVPANQ